MAKIWMQPPGAYSQPVEVEDSREVLVPLMVRGYRQCAAPTSTEPKPPVMIWLQPPDVTNPPIEVEESDTARWMARGYTKCAPPKG